MLPHVGRQPASTSAAIVALKIDKKRRKRPKNISSGWMISLVSRMNDLRWSVNWKSIVRTKLTLVAVDFDFLAYRLADAWIVLYSYLTFFSVYFLILFLKSKNRLLI